MIIRLPYYKHKINIFNLFNKKRHPFFLLIKKRGEIMKSRFFNINRLNCLSKNDVITARISDHQPVIYQDILFWNIMMQCKKRQLNQKIVGYNNGFGFVENQSQYHLRLVKIAIVIAEILYYQPNIHIIGLCEGPILKEDQVLFFKTLKIFSHLERFVSSGQFNHPNESNADKWGLLMLADKKFSVIAKKSCFHKKLTNRIQTWKLIDNNIKRHFTLVHFPFSGNDSYTNKNQVSVDGHAYCIMLNQLLEKYINQEYIIAGDFNFNPFLISEIKKRYIDKIPINNSILLNPTEKINEFTIKNVTVDGILLSIFSKQKYLSSCNHINLRSLSIKEYRLFQPKPLLPIEYEADNQAKLSSFEYCHKRIL